MDPFNKRKVDILEERIRILEADNAMLIDVNEKLNNALRLYELSALRDWQPVDPYRSDTRHIGPHWGPNTTTCSRTYTVTARLL